MAGDDFWSWFELVMKEELALCLSDETHAEDRRTFVMNTWLRSAPAAGHC